MTRPAFATLIALSNFLHAAPEVDTAASARIWLRVPPEAAPLSASSDGSILTKGDWLPTTEEKIRLTDITFPISPDEWKKSSINFTTAADTSVTLSLLGPWNEKGSREEVLYDHIRVSGATLANPSFEEKTDTGFTGWQSDQIPFDQWPLMEVTALEGKSIAAAWNNRTLSQTFSTKAGVPVTITLSAKAASPPGLEKLVPLGKGTPAHSAIKEIHRGVNFGNRWEVAPPFSWQIPYSVEDVDLAAAEGFDHIRIPISWHHYLSKKNGVTEISSKLFAEINPIIDRALAKKMHVIIDWHHFDPLTTDPDAYQQRFVDGWKAIANHYKDYPKDLWFELINEPKDELTTERLNFLQTHAIEALRRICPERVILVTVGKWSVVGELPKLLLPADEKNVIVTIHNYEPFHFTHQGATWTDLSALKGITYPGPPETPLAVPDLLKNNSGVTSFIENFNTLPAEKNPSSIATIRTLMDQAAAWSEKYGRPVHLGEFGAVTTADSASRARYIHDVRTLADERDIPWTLWDWKAGFAYWDEEAKAPLLRDPLFGE